MKLTYFMFAYIVSRFLQSQIRNKVEKEKYKYIQHT